MVLFSFFFNFLGKRSQLTTAESNASRRVTKLRWVVEAVHGILGRKYRLLHQQLDNKLLPKVKSFCRIASFLNNKFGKRLDSDIKNQKEILQQFQSATNNDNTLATEVDDKNWNRKRVIYEQLSSSDLTDFPEMTEQDLKILFTGTYQYTQSISYLAELLDEQDNIKVQYVRGSDSIVRFNVRSRHINAKTYKCYIEYEANSIGPSGIKRYCCECANGRRTLGCCSHVAAIIYYLSYARYLSKILKPAEILSKIFISEQVVPVINEDSDDED